MKSDSLILSDVPNTPNALALGQLLEITKSGDPESHIRKMLTDLHEAVIHNEKLLADGKTLIEELSEREDKILEREREYVSVAKQIKEIMASIEDPSNG